MVHRERSDGGFSRIRRITEEHGIYSAEKDTPHLHVVSGVSPIVYVLITNKLATLDEIVLKYSIWEVLDLYEIAMVNLYNRYLLIENKRQ